MNLDFHVIQKNKSTSQPNEIKTFPNWDDLMSKQNKTNFLYNPELESIGNINNWIDSVPVRDEMSQVSLFDASQRSSEKTRVSSDASGHISHGPNSEPQIDSLINSSHASENEIEPLIEPNLGNIQDNTEIGV